MAEPPTCPNGVGEGRDPALGLRRGNGEVWGDGATATVRSRAGGGVGGGEVGSIWQSPLRRGPDGEVAMGQTYPLVKTHQNRPALGSVCTRTRCTRTRGPQVFGRCIREGTQSVPEVELSNQLTKDALSLRGTVDIIGADDSIRAAVG